MVSKKYCQYPEQMKTMGMVNKEVRKYPIAGKESAE